MARRVFPETFRSMAGSRHVLGVENLFFLASAGPRGRANFSAAWNGLQRLGLEEEIGQQSSFGEAEPCIGDGFVAQGW